MPDANPAAAGFESPRTPNGPLPARLHGLPSRSLPGGLTVAAASRWRSRLLGLMAVSALPGDVGLHLSPCRSVHTVGMRFALDLVWLDASGEVVRVDREVSPGRLRRERGARSVIETAAGRGDAFAAAMMVVRG